MNDQAARLKGMAATNSFYREVDILDEAGCVIELQCCF
jgi:hypothetical protein